MVGEFVGLTLLGLGTLLFLALISYRPDDVPAWMPILANSAHGSHANHNIIGPTGAIIAGLFYMLVGAGSYAVATVLLGYGGAKLMAPELKIGRRTGWIAGAVISFACLADIQHVVLTDWARTMRIPGTGGWFGHFIGQAFP